jgi:hypothetical protein
MTADAVRRIYFLTLNEPTPTAVAVGAGLEE